MVRLFSSLALLVLTAISCTTDVTISMDETVPPTFKFERNSSEVNTLPFFDVIEIVSENQKVPYQEQSFDKNITLWRIVPEHSDTPITNLPPITYGRVPSGFVQKIPESGSPPSLSEGKLYQAGGPPVMMRRGTVRFFIRNGKAMKSSIPGLE